MASSTKSQILTRQNRMEWQKGSTELSLREQNVRFLTFDQGLEKPWGVPKTPYELWKNKKAKKAKSSENIW